MGKSTLGEKINRLRCERGLSCEELSNIVHVSKQTIMNWESGKMPQKVESLFAASKYFNVSIDDLLNDDLDIFSKEYEMKKRSEADMGAKLTIAETSVFLERLKENPNFFQENCSGSKNITKSIKETEEAKAEKWQYIKIIQETKKSQQKEDRIIVAISAIFMAILWLTILSIYLYTELAAYHTGIWHASLCFFYFDKEGILSMLMIYCIYIFIALSKVTLVGICIHKRRKREDKGVKELMKEV